MEKVGSGNEMRNASNATGDLRTLARQNPHFFDFDTNGVPWLCEPLPIDLYFDESGSLRSREPKPDDIDFDDNGVS